MHGRTSSSRPAADLATSDGSASVARTIDTRSAAPEAMTSSACASVVNRPTTMLGSSVASVICVLLAIW